MTVIKLKDILEAHKKMDYLWTVKEIRRACGVATKGADDEVHGISIDSRTVKKGDAFIALKNEKDGHDYVIKAYERGAICAIVEKEIDCPIAQIVVADTFKALYAMADYQRSHSQGKRIAVTGSCGKTSVKELLATALQCHKSEASYNNHWGVPLTLARMPRDAKQSVFEVGMNHAGEIAPLSNLVKPDVAIITNVAPAHIGAFDSLNDIVVEKTAILEGMKDKKNVIVPLDLYTKYPHYFAEKPYTFSYTPNTQASSYADAVQSGLSGQNIVANIMGEMVSFSITLLGEHQVLNALAVLTAVKVVGGDVQMAATNMGSQQAVEGRGLIHNIHGVLLVDESYNANPKSMQVALEMLKKRPGMGRRIAILGQMFELGDKSNDMHAALAPLCEELDTVITVGDDMKVLFDRLPKSVQKVHYPSQREVNIQKLATQLEVGDMVMVKGSNGTFWQWKFVPRLMNEIERLASVLKNKKA
ncbi:MAG: UDP-N-acetylmuramoyl-tripeptide--D-alanyl-D-alanine ligase [Alphaproteobacteria bacterium]|jgi:UDP-N-acetylmuramoyl-tripeptide--D-alanyl-D-alanine ligase